MTVAVPVRDVTYSGDALRGRIDDLTTALEHGMAAVVSSGTWTHDGPDRIRAAERIRLLLSELSRIRDALVSVWSSVHPAEQHRSASLAALVVTLSTTVMSGPAPTLFAAWNGHLWPALRPLADRVIEILPRRPADDDEVIVTAGASAPTRPPHSLRDRIDRIPSGNSHIRIERFPTEAGNRFEIYLSGTNFRGDDLDPWNVASNVDLAVTGASPSLRAVRLAMESAGVTATTPITITGHSQGGLLALAVARSADYFVDAVVTVGTPVGVIPDVDGIRTIHIVHPEDPIPALGGLIDTRSSTWIVPASNGERLFAAHHRDSYSVTAAELDTLNDSRLDLDSSHSGTPAVGVGREYLAVRSSGESRGLGAK